MLPTTWTKSSFQSAYIDLRSADEFQRGHIKNTTSLDWQRLPQSMHELPDKHQSLHLMGTATILDQAEVFLNSKGYKVESKLELSQQFWAWAETEQLTEQGCHTVPLWRANPLLEQNIELIESLTQGRQALDLACGAGRDAVYLANRGWSVTAMDYKQDALERCQSLADSLSIGAPEMGLNSTTDIKNKAHSKGTLATRHIDLEQQQPVLEDIRADLIVVMRYLHRPILPYLKTLLNPGGILCYSTFMIGSEQFGSPRNPNYLLNKGELAELYDDFNIHIDQQKTLPDERPVALFIAQK